MWDYSLYTINYHLNGGKNNAENITEYYAYDEYPFDLLWTCKECGQDSSSSIFDKKYGRHTCPYCNHKLPIPDKTSLEALYPELAEEWNWSKNPFKPSEVFPTSPSLASWICNDCKTPFTTKIIDRINGKKCPNCSSAVRITPEEYQEIVSESIDSKHLDLTLIPLDNKVIRYWDCKKCEQRWSASFYERFYKKKTCPYCDGFYAIPGKTSFKALYPKLANELSLHNLVDPDKILPTHTQYLQWICPTCNMDWNATIADRVDGSAVCPYCSGKKAIPRKTSFKALYPEMAKELATDNLLDSDSILPTYKTQVTWSCHTCFMDWKATIADRVD